MPDLGPNYLTSLQRYDDVNIIAANRQLCQIFGVAVYYSATDLVAGTIMAADSSKSGAYVPYASGGSNGTNVAMCVLERTLHAEDFQSTTGTAFVQGIFSGAVFFDKLVGYAAGVLTDMRAKKVTGADGVNVLLIG